MRSRRHDPIAVPLGHTEWTRADCHVPTGWDDLSPETRAAARAGAIATLRATHGVAAEEAIDVITRCWR